MWRSSQGLLRKVTVTMRRGVVVSVRQRRMSTAMSFGSNFDGALGLPTIDYYEHAYKPTAIPSLPSDIVSIHAGHHHSLALTSQGQLWAWGCNDDNQLGRGIPDWKSWIELKRVEGLENVNVCTVFASKTVSAALGDDGSIWVWGKSMHGQLGLAKHTTEAILPTRIEALSGENIAKHALARTVDGKLFRWGYLNEEAMCKLPTIWEPHLVEELHGIEVLDIACGTCHSLILCRK